MKKATYNLLKTNLDVSDFTYSINKIIDILNENNKKYLDTIKINSPCLSAFIESHNSNRLIKEIECGVFHLNISCNTTICIAPIKIDEIAQIIFEHRDNINYPYNFIIYTKDSSKLLINFLIRNNTPELDEEIKEVLGLIKVL